MSEGTRVHRVDYIIHGEGQEAWFTSPRDASFFARQIHNSKGASVVETMIETEVKETSDKERANQ